MKWYKAKERGGVLRMQFLFFLIKRVPPLVMSFFVGFLVFFYVLFVKNIRIWVGDFHLRAKEESSFGKTFNTVRNFAQGMLDRVYVVMGRTHLMTLNVHNPDPVLKLVEDGRGAILLGSHFGPLELSRIWPEGRRFKINILMHGGVSPVYFEQIQKIDPTVEERIIKINESSISYMLDVKEKLDNGEFISIMGDRLGEANSSKVNVPFLGKDKKFSLGPYSIAMFTKCPIILIFVVKSQKNTYELYIEELAGANIDSETFPSRKERKDYCEQLATSYVSRLEWYAQNYPLSWSNFYDYWNE